jgi:cytochrome P450
LIVAALPFVIHSLHHIEQVFVTESHKFTAGDPGRDAFSGVEDESLVVSEGQTWHRQRQQLQPDFYRERITTYIETMVKYAERIVDRWTAGETMDIMREMDQLTLAILARTLFDHDLRENQTVVRIAVDALIE